MRTVLNVIWLVLCGFWMAIAYALAGLVCFALFFLIVTIPLGLGSFKIIPISLMPLGVQIIPVDEAFGMIQARPVGSH